MAERIQNNPSIGLTPNESHGLKNVTGSLDRGRTGFAAEIVVVPNDSPKGPSVKELPSQNA